MVADFSWVQHSANNIRTTPYRVCTGFAAVLSKK